MVPRRGIAPRSVGYRPTALLLSYRGRSHPSGSCTPDFRTWAGCVAVTPTGGRNDGLRPLDSNQDSCCQRAFGYRYRRPHFERLDRQGIAPCPRASQSRVLIWYTSGRKIWSRAPVLPRAPPASKAGGFAGSLARAFSWGTQPAALSAPAAGPRIIWSGALPERTTMGWLIGEFGRDRADAGRSRDIRSTDGTGSLPAYEPC